MKRYINFDTMVGFGSGNYIKDPVYPLRVGRKQKRAILDANSAEVVIFEKGYEQLAKLTCDLLNSNNIDGLPWLLSKCEQNQHRYIKAEGFIRELSEMNFFQRIFCIPMILIF